MRKLRSVLAGAALVILVGVLSACGQNSNQQAATKQVLNLPASAALDTIDLSKATGYGQTGNVFESFYRLGKNGKATAGLAKSAKVSADGKQYTFTLRNAKWSNGDPITAQDFVYSWRRTLNPKTKSPYAYLFEGIQNATAVSQGKTAASKLGIKATDQHTVVVTLDKAIPYFKVLMAYPLFAPQNQKVAEKYGKKYATKSQYMVYSGPFKITNWKGTNNKWSFVKNNQYWDKKVVKLQKINFTVVENASTSLDLYQSDKFDLTQLSSEQVATYKNSKAYIQYPYSYVSYVGYNFADSDATKRKVLNNQDIRQAFSLAVNRKQLAQKVIGDGTLIPTGFVSTDLAKNPTTGKDFSVEQKRGNTMSHDEKLAQQKWQTGLAATGVKKVSLTLLAANDNGSDQATSKVTQYLKGQWEKLFPGLTIKIQAVPSQIALTDRQKGDLDLTLAGWGADFNDPISFLQIPTTGTSYNYGKYNNSEYNQLVDSATNADANDPAKRWSDLVSASHVLLDDQGITPLYQSVYSYLQRSSVKGIIHNTAGTQWNYKYTYIK